MTACSRYSAQLGTRGLLREGTYGGTVRVVLHSRNRDFLQR